MINECAVLINSIATAVTVVLSFVTIIQARSHSKEEQQRFKEELEENRKQFEAQLKHSEEIRIVQEKPYLVPTDKDTEIESDGTVSLKIVLKNKGRGAAYSITPADECEAKDTSNEKKELIKCGSDQDPVVMVGEQLKLVYATEKIDTKFRGFRVLLPIYYKDASGRDYTQEYEIIVDDNGWVHVRNYAEPVLVKDDANNKL